MLNRRTRKERDLDRELRSYVEELSSEKQARGMPEREARRAALLELGGLEQNKESCRETWSLRRLDELMADLRYGVRGLIRTPEFSLTVIATIGLALGLNTALFTLFDSYVLRPLEVKNPHSLYEFAWTTQTGSGHVFTAREADAVQREKSVFSDVLLSEQLLTQAGGSQLYGQLVSDNYFDMLGVNVAMGRPLLPGDAAVAVIGYDTWRSRFGSDPLILGRRIYVRGQALQIVGVAKAGFTGLGSLVTQCWAPLRLAPSITSAQDSVFLTVTGRLNPGVSEEQARAALTLLAKQLTAEGPKERQAGTVLLVSRATKIPLNAEMLAVSLPLFVAFGLVIAIACANVANMMLARALARQRELGIRVSLGAARGRLIQQFVTESALLSVPAAIFGLAASQVSLYAGQRVLSATMPPAYAFGLQLPPLAPDIRVFGFVFAAALISALLFGLFPALQVTRFSLTLANRGEFGIFRSSRLRSALVMGQIAVCVLLLICSTVILRSRDHMSKQATGLDTRGVFFIRASDGLRERIAGDLRDRVAGSTVAAVWRVPLHGRLRTVPVTPEGGGNTTLSGYNFVSPDYFGVLRVPVISGRNFTASEARAHAPVAIISEATARLYWPGKSALGRAIHIARYASAPQGNRQPASATATVVGVAGDADSGLLADGVDPTCVYFPGDAGDQGASLLVRGPGLTASSGPALKAEVDRVAPDAADQIASLDQALALQLYPFRLMFWISLCLGGLAFLLSVSGVYGVITYLVSQRTREFGIRMALGAGPLSVVGAVMRQSLRLGFWGGAVGIALALAVSPLIGHELQAVNPYDGVAYAAGVSLGVIAGLAASVFPSWRAARIDPAESLRFD